MWRVEVTDEFTAWWDTLTDDERASVTAGIELLEVEGPALGRPHADTLRGSRHPNLKELRTQHAGRPLRTLFAFDPRRTRPSCSSAGTRPATAGSTRVMIPLADDLYDVYLSELRKERLI